MKKIEDLSKMIRQGKEESLGETATKLNKIVPFFRALGYNDSNPDEFRAEVNVDLGSSLPRRVDFACGNGKSMQMFIEAKKSGKRLRNDMSQLKDYYDTDGNIFLGILTNGDEYLFFRDGDTKGIMDIEPFYEIDMRFVDEGDMMFLKKLQKGKLTRRTVKSIKRDPYLIEKELRQQIVAFCN